MSKRQPVSFNESHRDERDKSKVASTEIVRAVITHNSFMQKFHHLYCCRCTPSFSRKKRMSAIMPKPRTRCLMSCL